MTSQILVRGIESKEARMVVRSSRVWWSRHDAAAAAAADDDDDDSDAGLKFLFTVVACVRVFM